MSTGPLPVAYPLRPWGSAGDSQLHRDLLPRGAGREDTDILPQPSHRHHCQTQHMGSCTGESVHTTLCYTVLHCVTLLHCRLPQSSHRHHCQTQHMGWWECTHNSVLHRVTLCYTVLYCVTLLHCLCDILPQPSLRHHVRLSWTGGTLCIRLCYTILCDTVKFDTYSSTV